MWLYCTKSTQQVVVCCTVPLLAAAFWKLYHVNRSGLGNVWPKFSQMSLCGQTLLQDCSSDQLCSVAYLWRTLWSSCFWGHCWIISVEDNLCHHVRPVVFVQDDPCLIRGCEVWICLIVCCDDCSLFLQCVHLTFLNFTWSVLSALPTPIFFFFCCLIQWYSDSLNSVIAVSLTAVFGLPLCITFATHFHILNNLFHLNTEDSQSGWISHLAYELGRRTGSVLFHTVVCSLATTELFRRVHYTDGVPY